MTRRDYILAHGEADILLRTYFDSLEKTVRECLQAGNHERVGQIIDQLCQDYAYSVHQPHARNGGLIGLAAASIALGPVRGSFLGRAGYGQLC